MSVTGVSLYCYVPDPFKSVWLCKQSKQDLYTNEWAIKNIVTIN